MPAIDYLLSDLEETKIARRVGIPHDETRMRFSLHSNTVASFDEFSTTIGNYYNYHFCACVAVGGRLSRTEAVSQAKEILTQEYRRRGGDIVMAYNDAKDGTNGGMRAILDMIADSLKAKSVENYIRDAFDRYMEPSSWDKKVEIIRQFVSHCGTHLSSSIRASNPEAYAHDAEMLIRSYVDSLKRTSSIFRRY